MASREDEVRMTADNVLHSCSPGTKVRHKDRSTGLRTRLEAVPADLEEKHEPRGGAEVKKGVETG